jgi:hypothetical protein
MVYKLIFGTKKWFQYIGKYYLDIDVSFFWKYVCGIKLEYINFQEKKILFMGPIFHMTVKS